MAPYSTLVMVSCTTEGHTADCPVVGFPEEGEARQLFELTGFDQRPLCVSLAYVASFLLAPLTLPVR
jgi:hypothetical protein